MDAALWWNGMEPCGLQLCQVHALTPVGSRSVEMPCKAAVPPPPPSLPLQVTR